MTSNFTVKYKDFSKKSFNKSWVFKYIPESIKDDIIITLQRLKPSPKADINIALWASLYKSESIRVLVNQVPVMFISGSFAYNTLRSSIEWTELVYEDMWDSSPAWDY